MKEDWTKQMKQKLEGHKMTPPAGLWEGISNQMGLEPAPAAKPAITRRLYWAAAAVVLALVGFFAFYNFNDEQPKLEAKNEIPTESRPVNQEPANQPISVDEPAITAESTSSAKPKLLAMGTQQIEFVETNNMTVVDEQPEADIVEQPTPSVEEKSEPQQEIKSEPQQKKQTFLPDVIEPTTTASYSESSSKWTIGLAGSNGLLLAANNYVNSMNTQPLYNDVSPAEYYTNDMSTIAKVYTYTDVESKHHIPLRLGLSLHYQLNNRLALLSGINYTYLESEFSYPQHNHLDFNQRLSYLGIPIGISWKVWSTEHFNIYLAGGTMLEKCIKADVSEGDLNTHPWQWSINASAGAEYNFTRQFGIYLEPSLGYFFKDGTKLEHYYKEHPLAPSLQFGLRLHLK
jgi:hypothetical protein